MSQISAVQRPIGVDLGHHPHPARNGLVAALGYFGVQHGVLPDLPGPGPASGSMLVAYLIK
jgi:hypothetical protein